ncbi:MAG: AbrB/MazE/SpoVT family DNA-binding domain-containing protein [Rhodanobacteraceae bacterium]|nr:AbrB/MazE/SpoVT family DNA-binding domain-containing protein [Rhodanobacteraceae bacterium]MBP9155277.1 AbrB/MazE/SpoVT family DNA-binding domain-containing protein [Xanthomonadales bacterium]HQW81112.1 AbrB/MazE/SpoVT family DNA-binding domain-containing protein [Pseudomonadota bacterium]
MAIAALTIRAIGNSSGVVLPKELLELLNVKQGDKLFVMRTPEGIALKPYDEDFAEQMDLAREIMREDRNILRELAK